MPKEIFLVTEGEYDDIIAVFENETIAEAYGEALHGFVKSYAVSDVSAAKELESMKEYDILQSIYERNNVTHLTIRMTKRAFSDWIETGGNLYQEQTEEHHEANERSFFQHHTSNSLYEKRNPHSRIEDGFLFLQTRMEPDNYRLTLTHRFEKGVVTDTEKWQNAHASRTKELFDEAVYLHKVKKISISAINEYLNAPYPL